MRYAAKILCRTIILGLCLTGLSPATISQAGGFHMPCTDAQDFKFTVEIVNVSDSSLTPTSFAPGIWVLHAQPAPLFQPGEPDRNFGLQALAEDGNPAVLAGSLTTLGRHHDVFDTPKGSDEPGPLLPGARYSFTVRAVPGYEPNLSFALMFVQSNDWFIGTDENGIALINAMNGPRAPGDVTAQLYLWDAGTEADEPPGAGPHQAPRQAAPNTGPADPDDTVRPVRHAGIPAVSDLVQVTITRALPTVFDVSVRNISGQSDYTTPFSPGIFVAHTDPDMFYLEGHPALFFEGRPNLGNGLETLAEDGNPDDIYMSVITFGYMAEPQKTSASGVFNTPMGMAEPGPIPPGGAYSFTVSTDQDKPHLSLALMFGQSNDWFVATPAQGVSLFQADGSPISGIIPIHVFDAGTEEDEPFAAGMYQAPRQSGPNTGPADDDTTVRRVEHMDAQELLEVTVTPRVVQTFRIAITNISENDPIAPGLAVSHRTCEALFSAGMSDRGAGLETLAEDGHPNPLAASLTAQGLSPQIVNMTPAGDAPGPLLPGTTYEFMMEVDPAAPYLSLAFMYVRSNDLFIGTPAGGMVLWNTQGHPLVGDVTAHMSLWDAGTERNQVPGTGSDQPLMQSGPNTGPADPNPAVRLVSDGYDYPAIGDLVIVTVTPVNAEIMSP